MKVARFLYLYVFFFSFPLLHLGLHFFGSSSPTHFMGSVSSRLGELLPYFLLNFPLIPLIL